MIAARNRRFRIAAALTAASWLFLVALETIDADHVLGRDALPAGYGISAVLYVGAHVVGACGWVFHLVAVFDSTHEADYRAYYVLGGLGALLIAVGVCVAVSGLVDSRRGEARAWILWLVAAVITAASLATTVGLLFLRSFYSNAGAVHEPTTGTLIEAVGALGTALAAFVLLYGVRRPIARREAILCGAAENRGRGHHLPRRGRSDARRRLQPLRRPGLATGRRLARCRESPRRCRRLRRGCPRRPLRRVGWR